jgi:transcription antitermination factor NusG
MLDAEAFLPLRKLHKQWSDRVKVVEESAFKSYIFAKLTGTQVCMVERLAEFCCFISYGGGGKSMTGKTNKYFPFITDQDTITKVLAIFPSAQLQDINTLNKGSKVQINHGSLANYQGTLLAAPTGNKVAIDIKGLAQSLVINVPLDLLRAIA